MTALGQLGQGAAALAAALESLDPGDEHAAASVAAAAVLIRDAAAIVAEADRRLDAGEPAWPLRGAEAATRARGHRHAHGQVFADTAAIGGRYRFTATGMDLPGYGHAGTLVDVIPVPGGGTEAVIEWDVTADRPAFVQRAPWCQVVPLAAEKAS